MDAVVPFDDPFGVEVVIGSAEVGGRALHQDAGIFVHGFPDTGGVGDPHHADDAVAVQILGVEAGHPLLKGIGAVDRAELFRGGQHLLRAVGADAGDDIDSEIVQQICDIVFLP